MNDHSTSNLCVMCALESRVTAGLFQRQLNETLTKKYVSANKKKSTQL